MSDAMATFRVLLLIALRNLRSHRLKTIIVGVILCFGSILIVLGTSLLDSIEDGMTRSITSSLAGHAQVYSAEAEDELALFAGLSFDNQHVGELRDFGRVRRVLESHENVRAVVPQGIGVAAGMTGNETDAALGKLRAALDAGDLGAVQDARERIVQIARVLEADYRNRLAIVDDREKIEPGLADLSRVQEDAFWAPFARLDDPDGVVGRIAALEFLDTRLAPLTSDGRMLFVRYIGTDLDRFQEHFDSFYIVRGEMVPAGQRGLVIGERTAERYLKNRVARQFDAIHREVVEKGRSLASSSSLRSQVDNMVRQYNAIVLTLGPRESAELEEALRRHFPQVEGGLVPLLERLLAVDDATIEAHYQVFYEEVAPRIRLYAMDVGDTVTLRTMTRAGFLRAVNVKVYGTFHFRGLETSDIAGTGNLIDMLTFRELYGVMTDEQLAELEDIRQAVGVEDVGRDAAEDALFGGGDLVVDLHADALEAFGSFEDPAIDSRDERLERVIAERFTPEQVDQGLALNAAVILHDPGRLDETLVELRELSEREGLGLKVVDWLTAAGIAGQFITVIRLVLYIAIGIIFLIALVIINNAMVMATLERTGEIGTMRAIGAQRRFVMAAFLIETLVLGLLSGGLGTALAAIAVLVMGQFGIPATSDVMVFLFSGPRLYPTLSGANLAAALVAIVVVSLLSTFYPARLATRIQPVTAMRRGE